MWTPPVETPMGVSCPCAPERQGCQTQAGAEGATAPQPEPRWALSCPLMCMQLVGMMGHSSQRWRRPGPRPEREEWSLKPRRVENHAARLAYGRTYG